MAGDPDSPILHHPLGEPSAFTARSLMKSVRRIRNIPAENVPAVCILDFDGDLTDWLVQQGLATPFAGWACFHTAMFVLEVDGIRCGLIARTIGAPYAVLIAEQLHAAGAGVIIGLTSAGRVSPELPLPCLLVVTAAIRDEGTSYHYLPPSREVTCPTPITPFLAEELRATGWAVRSGTVWTTDAPYRETSGQLESWAKEGVSAVEMQAAGLFAFGIASGAAVATVAVVSNAVDHSGEQFDTGPQEDGWKILAGLARAGKAFLGAPGSGVRDGIISSSLRSTPDTK